MASKHRGHFDWDENHLGLLSYLNIMPSNFGRWVGAVLQEEVGGLIKSQYML